MHGRETSDTTKQIWDLFLKGKSVQEIASELGVKRYHVSSALSRGREKGIIPRANRVYSTSYMLGKFGLKAGKMIGLMDQLSADQRVWLCTEASKIGCETIEEYLLEKVRDEYEESNIGK